MGNDTVQFAFNGQPIFQPGAEVSGCLLLHLNEPMKARSVKIAVDGRASTHWTETESTSTTNSDGTSSSSSTTVHYNGTVVYVAGECFAWNSGSAQYLQAGNHSFPFSFQLPAICPPSFEAGYGNIRYGLKATIDRPWRFDTKGNANFHVAPAPDFALLPSLNFPIRTEVSKELGMILFRHGWLSMQVNFSRRHNPQVTLPKQGYAPGESLPVQILVKNSSTRDVESLKVQLKKYAHFIAYRNGHTLVVGQARRGGHTRAKKEIVATLSEGVSVKKESSARLERCLHIPWTEPTLDSSVCPIIQITYKLKVTLWAQGSVGNKLKAALPITIGANPPHRPAVTSSAFAPSAPPEAPPTYEQSFKQPYS